MPPIFRQKLVCPPPWEGATPRPRLAARLDAAIAASRHAVLVAGAGFGKTTLLAAWAAGRPSAWIGLDPDDADLDGFLAYLIAACEGAVPGFATEARALLPRARERDAAQATLATLLADLEEQCERPFVLILDDYHLASSPSLDALLERLLKYLPAQVRLVVSTAAEPAIGLAALRAARRVELVGEADLAFDADELARVAPAAGDPGLAARAGGWPAAMGMPPDLLDAYVEERFLRDLAPDVRDALAALALVDAFDPAFFMEVVGQAWDASWQDRLVKPRLVMALAEGQLAVPEPLRGLLRRQAFAGLKGGDRPRLARVGGALWQAGQHAAALRFWVDAGEQAIAARRLEGLAPAWLAEGRLEALASALAALGVQAERPGLLLADGELRRRWGDAERAGDRFARAAAAFAAQDDAAGAARAHLGVALTAAAAGREAEARAALATARPDLPADDAVLADVHNLEGGLALMGGSVEEALASYEASLRLARRRADPYAAARAIHNMGVCHTRLDELPRALACYDEALAAPAADGTPVVWMTPINRALILIYMERPAEARAAAEAALEVVRRFQLGREEGYALRTLGYALARLGDPEGAAGCYESAAWTARRKDDAQGLALSRNFAAELALEQGDVAAALRASDEVAAALGGEAGFVRVPECGHVRARVLAAAGLTEEADALFAALEARARAIGHRLMLADLAKKRGAAPPPPPALPAHDEPEAPLSGLDIRCFGRLRVARDGQEVTEKEWQSARAKVLLAYLLHVREGALKDDLFEVLFPGEEVNDSAIYMTMLRLRKALEPGLEKGQPSQYVLRADGRYVFNRQARFRLDTQEFEAAVRRARRAPDAEAIAALDEALALYQGDFLPEFDHAWIAAHRLRLREEALAACERRLTLGGGPLVELAIVQRALAIDPLSDEFNRELILRYVEADQPRRAVEHYKLCERRYRDALDMDPPADLQELVAKL